MAKNYDWNKIEAEYIGTSISQKNLSEKYGVPLRTIQDKSRKNNWSEKRKNFRGKVVAKSVQKMEKNSVERVSTILRASDKLIETISQALEDPDMFYRILKENKSTGRMTAKKTKVLNTKRVKEIAEALKQIGDVYKNTDDQGDDAGKVNITLNVKGTDFDIEKYGG